MLYFTIFTAKTLTVSFHVDNVVEAREKHIHDILVQLALTMESLQVGIESGHSSFCQHPLPQPDARACDAVTLGSIVTGLGSTVVEAALAARRGAAVQYPHRIAHLLQQIHKVRVVHCPAAHGTHEKCNPIPQLLKHIKTLHPSPFNKWNFAAEDLAYLEKQAGMMSLFRP